MSLLLLGAGGGSGSAPQMARYLFIDGRYLDLRYSELISGFFNVPGDLDVAAVIAASGAQRRYYYNAIDDKQRPNESDEAHEARVDAQVKRIEAVEDIPGCHVRYGSISGRRIRKRRQKKVDVQLAVDALLHSFHRNIFFFILVAGDLDFKPLVDALVSLGVHTEIWYEPKSSSREFYSSSDKALTITLRRAWEWSTEAFQRDHPLPGLASYSRKAGRGWQSDAIERRRGTWQGHDVVVIQHGTTNNYYIDVTAPVTGHGFRVNATDLPFLERYFEAEYGPIEWTIP